MADLIERLAIRPTGKPLRLRELSDLTGRNRASLMADIERGDLIAFQYLRRPGSPWMVERSEALAWWSRITRS